jgi:phosphate uptake regulator
VFKRFKELFGSENLLDAAYQTTLTMIEFDQQMYAAARHTLRESETDDLPFDVHTMDRQINHYEREVRRQVMTHLTVAGNQNLVPGLALVSIVIDVERIGDYTKNIVDLAKTHRGRLHGGRFEESLRTIEATNDRAFRAVLELLETHDPEKARTVMQSEAATAKLAEAIISDLIVSGDQALSIPDAVALGLYARYLKRINAHLTNIASSFVNPFPRIGFREKPPKD